MKPAKRCAQCELEAVRPACKPSLCIMHYRFLSMRNCAQQSGKTIPTYNQLATLVTDELLCGDCGIRMNWERKDGTVTVATLQHYRSGEFGLVCQTCNTRHHFMPGDSFRELSPGQKWCKHCKVIKPFADFVLQNKARSENQFAGGCRQCRKEKSRRRREGEMALRAPRPHGLAKLTLDQVREVRRSIAANDTTQRALSERLGVTPMVINNIVHGRTYRQI